MGFQIFNFEDNSNVSVVNRKGIFKVIQYDKDLSCTAEDAQTKFYMSQMNVKKRQLTKETLKSFRIGFSGKFDELYQELKKQGFQEQFRLR